jgi:6-phosphogluconolactonase
MTRSAKPDVTVLTDPAALARHAADIVSQAASRKQGRFAVALSGGSTPRALYALLAQPDYSRAFPWERTHWFWGDERFVPHDDPLSNYRMVREAMLSHAPVPAENIHAVPTEGMTPEAAAQAYQRILQDFYGAPTLDPEKPLFDINLLGLGPDGHTASLFPDTDALNQRDRWVTSVIGAKAEARITLTYPALESSMQAIFLVAGKDKAPMLKRLIEGDQALPAARLSPTGRLSIFADRQAMESEK